MGAERCIVRVIRQAHVIEPVERVDEAVAKGRFGRRLGVQFAVRSSIINLDHLS